MDKKKVFTIKRFSPGDPVVLATEPSLSGFRPNDIRAIAENAGTQFIVVSVPAARAAETHVSTVQGTFYDYRIIVMTNDGRFAEAWAGSFSRL